MLATFQREQNICSCQSYYLDRIILLNLFVKYYILIVHNMKWKCTYVSCIMKVHKLIQPGLKTQYKEK